jgi:hypothetical protein
MNDVYINVAIYRKCNKHVKGKKYGPIRIITKG